MASDTTIDGTPASLEGQTIGVVKDTASAQVLKSVVPGASLKSFTTPQEALDAFYAGDVPILGGGTLWLAANSRIDKTALLPFRPYGRFGTQIPTQVLLERFEEGPPLTSFTSN